MQQDNNYINVTCPNYSTSTTSCSIDTGNRSMCSGQTSLYCYNGMYVVWIIGSWIVGFVYSGAVETQCSNGNVRLGQQLSYGYGLFHNDTSFRIGYIEVCINGSYYAVCNDNLDVELTSYLCASAIGQQLGYKGALYGSESDYLKPGTSLGIHSINCSTVNYFSTLSCSYSTVVNNSNGCNANGGPALVTCANG